MSTYNNALFLKYRRQYQPKVPALLQKLARLSTRFDNPKTKDLSPSDQAPAKRQRLRVGVVLSGGQAPGGHNVICGLMKGLQQLAEQTELIGFLGGPNGILQESYRLLTEEDYQQYINTGGFDWIGSGRTKIETAEQFALCDQVFRKLQLDGLVVIGGDDSNTNAALLADDLKKRGCPTTVVGVPKTIDGDLRSPDIEVSFGFDSAAKLYSELISNIAIDARSARKYYHFIRLMGRSASHITLEAALRTQPNLAFISEEVRAKNQSLMAICQEIVDLVTERANAGKNFGVILVPEGLIEFIPEMSPLIQSLNDILATTQNNASFVEKRDRALQKLDGELRATFAMIPEDIQKQLLFDRDPHGNVQVSKIETEKLLSGIVTKILQKNAAAGIFKGKFAVLEHFFGYEGRCLPPSNFDADYTYNLGLTAATMIQLKLTGHIAAIRHLSKPAAGWQPVAVPLNSLMTIEKRHGQDKVVIEKALVKLDSPAFMVFAEQRRHWRLADEYAIPGPVQYFGPAELCDQAPLTLTVGCAL